MFTELFWVQGDQHESALKAIKKLNVSTPGHRIMQHSTSKV